MPDRNLSRLEPNAEMPQGGSAESRPPSSSQRLLIVADGMRPLRETLAGLPPCRLLNLEDGARMAEVEKKLLASGARRVDRRMLFRENSESFRRDYIDFMGRLNAANASFDWWAQDFPSKNMLATNLGQNIFYCSLISSLMANDPESTLVVLSEDDDLASQLALFAKSQSTSFVDLTTSSRRRLLARLLPVYPVAYAIRAFVRASRSRRLIRYRPPETAVTVFASLVNHQSFDKDGTYRDAYLGQLVRFEAERGRPFVVFGKIIGDFDENLSEMARQEMPLIPMEHFLSLSDAFSFLMASLRRFFRRSRLRGDTLFGEVDVRLLIERQMEQARVRKHSFNLLFYYAARALARRVRVASFLYPFENRAFEKLYVTALGEAASESFVVGYNHASVTLKHTNLFLGPGEFEKLPSPHRLVTLGEISYETLTGEAGFPARMVEVGCGLRHSVPARTGSKPRPKRVHRLFLVLTAEVEEYLGILRFVSDAFRHGAADYEISIRPHPVTPLSRALELLPPLPFEYTDVSSESLPDLLAASDVVLYTSSTVGIEALLGGTPVIYLDYGDIIVTDPLFSLQEFKWTAREPSELSSVLKAIEALPDDEYARARERAAEMASRYILPPTADNLERFERLLMP